MGDSRADRSGSAHSLNAGLHALVCAPAQLACGCVEHLQICEGANGEHGSLRPNGDPQPRPAEDPHEGGHDQTGLPPALLFHLPVQYDPGAHQRLTTHTHTQLPPTQIQDQPKPCSTSTDEDEDSPYFCPSTTAAQG